MNLNDACILQKCHDDAVTEMEHAAVAVAEEYYSAGKVEKATLARYNEARMGVESTRKDLEYCIGLELAAIDEA